MPFILKGNERLLNTFVTNVHVSVLTGVPATRRVIVVAYHYSRFAVLAKLKSCVPL